MNEPERTCLICLDPPLDQNPLFLLTCGCNTAWFHESCENLWLTHQSTDEIPKCPTCRRFITFEYKYSFHYKAGINQKYFWWCCSLVLIDFFTAFVFLLDGLTQAIYLPLQSCFILTIPLVSKSRYDLLYFLHQIRYRYLVFAMSWVIHVFKYKKLLSLYPDNTINILVFVSSLHVICLLIQEIQNFCSHDHYHVHPYIHYIVGYTFLHKDTLHFRKSSPTALEGNKDPIVPLRRSSRLSTSNC
jgi:hypothetical protein